MGRHETVAELVLSSEYASANQSPAVADIGSGAGRTVRALLAAGAGQVHALDQASLLDDDLLTDRRVRSLITELDKPELPVPAESVDGATSVNVAEHLADPINHVAAAVAAIKPGGLFVLAHSDWDTALFTSENDALTRLLVDRFVASLPHAQARSDGFMGRKLLAVACLAQEAGVPVDLVDLQAWTDVHRRFDTDSVAWKVATSMVAAACDDPDLQPRAAAWLGQLHELAAADHFMFTVTDVAVVLRKQLR